MLLCKIMYKIMFYVDNRELPKFTMMHFTGFRLLNDSKTCAKDEEEIKYQKIDNFSSDVLLWSSDNEVVPKDEKCYSSCNHVVKLEEKIKILEEKVMNSK